MQTCLRKRLTRKSSKQYFEVWYFTCVNLGYISGRYLSKINTVCFLCVGIPFGRKHASTFKLLKRHSYTANTSKQINKTKSGLFFFGIWEWCYFGKRHYSIKFKIGRFCFSVFPAPKSTFSRFAHTKGICKLLLC